MAKIFPIYRKIANIIVSSAGFIASAINWGLQHTNQIRLIAANTKIAGKFTLFNKLNAIINTGLASSKPTVAGNTSVNATSGLQLTTIAANLTNQLPSFTSIASIRSPIGTAINSAFTATLLGFAGVMDNIPLNSAAALSTIIKELLMPTVPAANIVQITYDLTSRKGANTATEANGPCGRQDFDTPANAVGIHDTVVATCAGNVLAARCGRLNMTFSPSFGKTNLTIVQVQLHFYYQITRLLTASASGGYTLGGDTQLFSDTASANYLTTPRTFDITTAIAGSWTNIDNIGAYLIADIGAAALNDNVSIDAVELEVTATLTEAV